jgi:hypothetical protein
MINMQVSWLGGLDNLLSQVIWVLGKEWKSSQVLINLRIFNELLAAYALGVRANSFIHRMIVALILLNLL